ncbi:hypothetical protein H5410_026267, partial [Solanum commersonii]
IINSANIWQSLLKNLKLPINHSLTWQDVLPLYLWNIWLTRNDNYHNNRGENIRARKALEQTIEFFALANYNCKTKMISIKYLKWTALPLGFKLNSDGSSTGSLKCGGTVVIRDNKRDWVLGYMRNLYIENNIKDHPTYGKNLHDCRDLLRRLENPHQYTTALGKRITWQML